MSHSSIDHKIIVWATHTRLKYTSFQYEALCPCLYTPMANPSILFIIPFIISSCLDNNWKFAKMDKISVLYEHQLYKRRPYTIANWTAKIWKENTDNIEPCFCSFDLRDYFKLFGMQKESVPFLFFSGEEQLTWLITLPPLRSRGKVSISSCAANWLPPVLRELASWASTAAAEIQGILACNIFFFKFNSQATKHGVAIKLEKGNEQSEKFWGKIPLKRMNNKDWTSFHRIPNTLYLKNSPNQSNWMLFI